MEAKVFSEVCSSIFPDRELSPSECSRLVEPAFNGKNEDEKVGGRVDKRLVLKVEAVEERRAGWGEEEAARGGEGDKVGKGSIIEFARDSLDDSSDGDDEWAPS